MKNLKYLFVLALVLVLQTGYSQQTYDFSSDSVIGRLRQDVYALASDEMQGREAGTEGERLAAAYITERMQEIGLQPMFGESFLQELTFQGPWMLAPGNFVTIDGRVFHPREDFQVLVITADAEAQGQGVYLGRGMAGFMGTDDYQDHQDLEGKIFFIEYLLSEELERESGMNQLQIAARKLQDAADHGAAAVVFVNTLEDREDPRLSMRGNYPRMDIPVVFARHNVLEAFKNNPEAPVMINTHLERQTFTAVNVAGYWDNQAETTVIIGGHYDHLGWGTSGSRSPGEQAIHYGADDNASGTAGVLEAARYLVNSDLTSNNYIFIGFTAEEKGLIGSRYFADSDAYDMSKVNYMFNYDMIGRLEDYSMSLIGTGTSPTWDELIDTTVPEQFNIRKSPGGLGGSDHSAFYGKNIPVIFFFTGIHDDYHRPTDTPDKVNYQGASEILGFSMEMIAQLDQADRLEFTPTPVAQNRRQRASGPTLGLMPDHAFQGQGLKVQAVVEDRPAQKAGIRAGDVITSINEKPVQEIYSYMQALEGLQTGQTVQVTVIREEQEMQLEVSL
ncbi:MAG: M20/M25/M40 family metallo-hydrolase [Bacteroidales bacterium]